MVSKEEIANKLLSLIRPYYKGLRNPLEPPEFKKSMKGEEVEALLLSIHELIVELKNGKEEEVGT